MLKYPFLLLDDSSLTSVLHQGSFKFSSLTFEEAKAIVNLHTEHDMICCFTNTAIENIIYNNIGISKKDFEYQTADVMEIGQDAIVFRLYETPSETQPIITTSRGNEAKKIQNIYTYCQMVSRIE